MTIKQQFIEATDKWYSYVSKGHHKDRDCRWYVSKEEDYAYGEGAKKSTWFVNHYGYVASEQKFIGFTEEDVMQQAIDFINNFIAEHL